jgi:sugar phosphate isomerase/epimerase
MKFGLLSVSYSGLFYAGEALSIEQQIYKARELGFDGLSKADRARIKEIAADQGIEICAIESLSNFAGQLMEERENNLAMMRLMLELAADLDVDIVKIFAAWPGVIDDEEEIALYGPYERGKYYKRLYPEGLRKWNRVVKGIREVADMAADMGITLALQNHVPVITPGYEDALAMKQEIDRKNVKLCLDAPLFYERQEDAYVREAVQKCGDDIVLTHYGAWNFTMDDDGNVIQTPSSSFGGLINYETFIAELHNIGYSGYLVSEYCLPALDNHRIAGIEAIDQANAMALDFIKDLVSARMELLRD